MPKSIEAALNYNEKKVLTGMAKCLCAHNYLNEATSMNFYQKLKGFDRRNSLNARATTKTLHVSLNFDPSEKPPENKLIKIAIIYMDKIGFGEQPFLVYKHEDAGHPHIHIVSTTIRNDGTRINTHNIGRNQSEKARKEIENLFGLVKAERQQHLMKQVIMPIDVEKAIYGKSETKRSISNVVAMVFNQYKFGSLPEFNAALKQFNVVADRGKEDGRIYKYRGLIYRMLDGEGNKVGVPIKASTIACKPVLKILEEKFERNKEEKQLLKVATKNVIDNCLQSGGSNLKNLVNALQQKGIYTLLRQNAGGCLYGITFVDNENKVVFNGSDLGKGYSVAALQRRLTNQDGHVVSKDEEKLRASFNGFDMEQNIQKPLEKSTNPNVKDETLLDLLLSSKQEYEKSPYHLLKKKRKKKRKNNSY